MRAIIALHRNQWNWDLRTFAQRLGFNLQDALALEEAQRLFLHFRELNNAAREFTPEQLLILLSEEA